MIYHPEKSVILTDKIGKDCTIHAPVWIGKEVVIGDRVKIQAFAFIPDGVIIGNDVFIGPHVVFTNDRHPPSSKDLWETTVVEDFVVICANVTVLPGTRLGDGCFIPAGVLVARSVLQRETVQRTPQHL